MPDTVETNIPAESLSETEEQSPVRPFWSGTISFGLVSIPVNLFPANRSSHMGLRFLAPDGTPVHRHYFSSKSDHELTPEQMVRGYEIEDDHYIVVTDDELEKLGTEKSKDIDLRLFVSEDAVSPLYFESGYFLAPSGDSIKAYKLLAAVMERSNRAGIATFVMRGKEYLIAILSENGILRAEILRFKHELRTPDDVGLPAESKPNPQMVGRFEKFVHKNSESKISRKELHDESTSQLLTIVKKKQSQKENVVETSEKQSKGAEVINILDVLKKSLAPHSRGTTKREPDVPRKLSTSSRTRLSKQPRARKKPGYTSLKKELMGRIPRRRLNA